VETSVTRDLLALSQRYALELSKMIADMEDADRSVGFNIELAAAELLLEPEAEVPAALRDSVATVVREGLDRTTLALRDVRETADAWLPDIETQIRAAVLDDLETLRVDLSDGRVAKVDAAMRSARPSLPAAVRPATVAARVRRFVRDRVDAEALESMRRTLGLRPVSDDHVAPQRFVPPVPTVSIPLVYRRLFSERALDAGELLSGRLAHADRVRDALQETGSSLRSVVITGPDGAGQLAVVRAALRALKLRGVHRIDLTEPVAADDVPGWFDRGVNGHVYVITGLRYLFRMSPGGFAPLVRLLDHIVDDRGRNAWILVADDTTWSFACEFSPLTHAFPSVVHLEPLDADTLEQAVRARHKMSGFSLRFSHVPLDADPRVQQALERVWFRDFHQQVGGVARDAMQLWLAAIVEVDATAERVVLGEVPQLPTLAMRHVTDLTAATLRAAVRQGWMDVDTCTTLFGEDTSTASARLAHLEHWGLLVRRGDTWQFPPHLRRSLQQVLRERGWTT
jgi:hypothetical protein